MPPPDLVIEPLTPHHNRTAFTCGVESLDRYLRTQATQDIRRKANAVFVMVQTGVPAEILGYVTLCATTLQPGEIPSAVQKHLPRYPLVSATLIGRLAIATCHQGQGLGGILLVNALRKAYTAASSVGSSMVVVDALNNSAAKFYSAHGFIQLPDSLRCVVPMQTIKDLLTER